MPNSSFQDSYYNWYHHNSFRLVISVLRIFLRVLNRKYIYNIMSILNKWDFCNYMSLDENKNEFHSAEWKKNALYWKWTNTINNDHINLQILKNCYHYCFSILIFRFSFILMHQAPLLHNKHKICQITHVFKIPFTNKLFSQKNSVDVVKHI